MRFDQVYNQEHFLKFLEDFLPGDFVEKEEDIVIKDRYKEITKAKSLGFCESLDVHVLEMEHGRENDPRIAIATDAFKILADHWIHKALVIFKSNNSDNYRFSYLTISLDVNDRNKVVRKYSNARRYSFYLGPNAKVRTPEQQLIKKGKVKDVEDLLSRFSVEVVNKQFYLEVAKYFDELVSNEGNNLALPSVSQENINIRKSFAVRLIGRLMFCWFLKQKKSDFGQLIPDELLASNVVSENYYHSILEPLFFEVLNTSIDTRGIRNELFDKVPYLNGGLFNPQYDDYYDLDRGTFTSKHINTLRISDTWFREFFELLETYNFTIDENTVFDQELSVDPEMLGRIFENLLAEINPETGSSERKRTGSFYTPRQIVEYMVDQSLIEYLKTKTSLDEKKLSALVSYDLTDDAEHPLGDSEKQSVINAIESLKLLDPACGSGAYPIGALQKIVYVLQQIDPDCKLWLEQKLKDVPELYKQKIINEVKSNPFDYTRKLDVIKNSIFGVDIQPIAVDVSRLRCFLTLVVESEIDDTKPNRGIEPLPNLDFKFVCANTLIGLPKSQSSNLFEDHSGITELSGIMSEYFSCNSQRKNEIRLKFSNTQKDILNRTLSAYGKNIGELTQKLTLWDPFSNKSNSWFDPEWMFGLEEKFDVVIGNPPYIQLQGNQGILADLYSAHGYYTFTRTGDIYSLFYERGLTLTKQETGLLCYITSNKWMKAGYGEKLRSYLSKYNPYILIDLGSEVFENASVHTNILLIKNQLGAFKQLSAIILTEADAINIPTALTERGIAITELSKETWIIGNESEQLLQKTIEEAGKPLKDFDVKIYRGLLTGLNEAFVIDQITRDRLIAEDSKNIEIIKPILRGRDIKRYEFKDPNLYILATGYDTDLPNLYPSIYKHLLPFEEKALKRDDKGRNWWNLRACAYYDEFEKDKIVWGNLATSASFSFVPAGYYISAPTNMLTVEDDGLYLLLAILNSKISNYQLNKLTYSREGGYREYKKVFIEQVIFPREIKKTKKAEIELLVKDLVNKKSGDINANTAKEQAQIDELVMDLYGLNEDEKEIIRNS